MSLIDRHSTPAQQAASRANGAGTTGPRTERGKSHSRLNAVKHWGRAEAIRDLMPALGETAEEYQALLDGLSQAIDPQDAFETMLVTDMADIQWRSRRSIRAEAAGQAKRRRQEMKRLDELNAQRENGGSLELLEQDLAPRVGFTNLPDSPAKFYRVIELLKAFAFLVRLDKMEEGEVYLKNLYGPSQSVACKELLTLYQLYLKALGSKDKAPEGGDTAGEANLTAKRNAVLEAVAGEIAWFEKRSAAERQATAEITAAAPEAEMLYSGSAPDRLGLSQDRQERRFEKKWEMLVRYRRWRRAESETAAMQAAASPSGDAEAEELSQKNKK